VLYGKARIRDYQEDVDGRNILTFISQKQYGTDWIHMAQDWDQERVIEPVAIKTSSECLA
jgi:hypothetical protein